MAAVPGRPDPWPTIGKLMLALLATGILASGLVLPFALGSGLVAKHYGADFLTTTCNLQETKPPQPTTLYARDNKTVVARLFTQDRKPVTLGQIPTYLQDALVATEDRRFYSHHGVDLRGLLRSAVSTTSGDTQGGSTLTMQYVKQIRYYQAGDDEKKQAAAIAQNVKRKMEDARCALDIEGPRHESKQTILDNYLNIAFFGEHAYGIQVAAETYFNKPAANLTLPESALLVGMLRAPSAYDPFVNRSAAKQRRDEVLQNLVAVGKLSQIEADKQKATPIALATQSAPHVKQGCANANSTIKNAAFFCDYTVRWLRYTDGLTADQLQTGGLHIITTLDPALQNSTQQHIAQSVPASSSMTAVLPAVDPRTGDILAMASSKTYGSRAGQTEQPIFTSFTAGGASTFKLFPLLAALQTGVPSTWHLTTEGSTGKYKARQCATPTNASNGDANISYDQTETLSTATAKSSNTFYVGMADQLFGCHLAPITDVMQGLGMKSMQQPSDVKNQTWTQVVIGKQRAQQLVLGSIPTSALELAGGYAGVANGGKFNAPAPVLAITDPTGNAVRVKRAPGAQVVSPQAAAQAIRILTRDTESGGTTAKIFAAPYTGGFSKVAGKTGTNAANSKDNSSLWFVGMTPRLVAASGLINFDQSSAASTGLPGVKKGQAYGDYAAKVWLKALKPSLQGTKWTWDGPNQVPGMQVPDISGLDLAAAKKRLADDSGNFKLKVLDALDQLRCASNAVPDSVAFYGPNIAPPGSTITVCQSSGVGQNYVVPAPPIVSIYPRVVNRRRGHNGNTRSGGGTSTHIPGVGTSTHIPGVGTSTHIPGVGTSTRSPGGGSSSTSGHGGSGGNGNKKHPPRPHH